MRHRSISSRSISSCPELQRDDRVDAVLIVRATKKLRQRLGSASQGGDEPSTTLLGDWYATILPWRPRQLVLLVNEQTLLPVLMPLAPAASASSRIGPEIAAALTAHQATVTVIDGELSQMRDCRFAPTANRSVVGIMTDFSFLADVYRHSDPDLNLLELAKRLATTPCSPLYRRHTSPDRELQAFLRAARPSSGIKVADGCRAGRSRPHRWESRIRACLAAWRMCER